MSSPEASPIETITADNITAVTEGMSDGRRWDQLADEQEQLTNWALAEAEKVRKTHSDAGEAFLRGVDLVYAVMTDQPRRVAFDRVMHQLLSVHDVDDADQPL